MGNTWRNVKERQEEIKTLVTPGCKVALFDTETTGTNPKKDRIIQFSGAIYKVTENYEFELMDCLNQYINPGRLLPIEYYANGKVKFSIAELTGITDEQLADKPSEKQAFPKIAKFMAGADVWAAYNAPFDINFLRETSLRTGIFLDERPILDVLVMARDIIPKDETENYKLGTITKYLFPDDNTAFHNAFNDVEATTKIFKFFISEYNNMVIEEGDKIPVHMERAGIFFNPYNWRQRRIRFTLSEGEEGDIFYDCWNKVWGHKATPSAKKLFAKIDLRDLESQFVQKYGFGKKTFDEIVDSWVEYKQNKIKEKKKH